MKKEFNGDLDIKQKFLTKKYGYINAFYYEISASSLLEYRKDYLYNNYNRKLEEIEIKESIKELELLLK